MSIAEQHDAISLTVLRQDGNLAASLTDTRLIAKLAHCALPEALLRDLQGDVQELPGLLRGQRSGESNAHSCLCTGAHAGKADLRHPAARASRQFLARQPGANGVGFNSTRPWLGLRGNSPSTARVSSARSSRFVDRSLPMTKPRAGSRRCPIAARSMCWFWRTRCRMRRRNRLRKSDQPATYGRGTPEVIGANAIELRRDDLLALIGESHVVHYVGPVDGSSLWSVGAPGGARGSFSTLRPGWRRCREVRHC